MKTPKEAKKIRLAIRALERVARGYFEVAQGCREFDALSMETSGGPSAWARPEGEKAAARWGEAATMAKILREGLGEKKGGGK